MYCTFFHIHQLPIGLWGRIMDEWCCSPVSLHIFALMLILICLSVASQNAKLFLLKNNGYIVCSKKPKQVFTCIGFRLGGQQSFASRENFWLGTLSRKFPKILCIEQNSSYLFSN